MRRYRVSKVNGTFSVVEARNISSAKKYVREEDGRAAAATVDRATDEDVESFLSMGGNIRRVSLD
jgi:hypothetical protein